MNVTLPRDQQEWLEAQVKAGVLRKRRRGHSRIDASRMLRELMELEPSTTFD